MIKLENVSAGPLVDAFIRLYGEQIAVVRPNESRTIRFFDLPDVENEYHDAVVRLNNRIYISRSETGRLGLSEPELFAALAHELGHILYRTNPFGGDHEERADTFAAQLGLGHQMIAVIEKIIASRRYRHLTSALVHRIHFLQHLA